MKKIRTVNFDETCASFSKSGSHVTYFNFRFIASFSNSGYKANKKFCHLSED